MGFFGGEGGGSLKNTVSFWLNLIAFLPNFCVNKGGFS
jgi:hypothetical protein